MEGWPKGGGRPQRSDFAPNSCSTLPYELKYKKSAFYLYPFGVFGWIREGWPKGGGPTAEVKFCTR